MPNHNTTTIILRHIALGDIEENKLLLMEDPSSRTRNFQFPGFVGVVSNDRNKANVRSEVTILTILVEFNSGNPSGIVNKSVIYS